MVWVQSGAEGGLWTTYLRKVGCARLREWDVGCSEGRAVADGRCRDEK